MDDRELLATAAAMALSYVGSVDDRPTTPSPAALAALAAFDEPLADDRPRPGRARCGCSPTWAAPPPSPRRAGATSASSPAPRTRSRSAARWLAAAWDQNAALPVMSPVAARLHDVVRGWLVDLLRLPADTGLAFVTGATVANAACLAAARDALLARLGWDAQADGLFGAPPLPVVIGERAHSTLAKSLGPGRAGPRRGCTWCPPTTRAGCAPTCCPTSPGPVLRVRPGRRGQHRRVRPVRRDRRLAGRAGRLAARRRGVRAVGAGRPDARRPRRRAGAGRLVGDRRAQVAQRRLRLRPGLRARPRGPAPHVHRGRGLPARRAAGSTPCTTRRSRRSGPGRWRCGRCCARSGGAASPSWSRGRARPPGRSPTRWPRAG